MKPFDIMTWASIVILMVGSSFVFLWFLRDAGDVLRGPDEASVEPDETENSPNDTRDPTNN